MKCLLRLHVPTLMSTMPIFQEKMKLLYHAVLKIVPWDASQSMRLCAVYMKMKCVFPYLIRVAIISELVSGQSMGSPPDILGARILSRRINEEFILRN